MLRHKIRPRASLLAISGASVAVGISSAVRADVSASWDGSTNNWSSAAHWSTNPNYPNNGTPTGKLYDVSIAGGSVTLDVNPTIQLLNLSGGEILGTDSLTIDGSFAWTGGALGANLESANGGIAFGNSILVLSVGMLTNASGQTATLGASGSSSIYMADGAIFDNAGTVSATDGSIFDSGGGTARTINNSGSFNANDSGGTIQIGSGLLFNNTGTVNAQAGELLLSGTDTGASTGSFSISVGATLAFAGTFSLAPAASLAGAGTVDFEGGFTTIDTASFSVTGPTNLTGGTLLVKVNESFGSLLNWTGGVLAPNTGVTLTAAHGIAFGTNVPVLDIGTLTNPSGQTATLGASGTSDVDLAAGATFDNAGTVSATNGGFFDVGGGTARTVENSGTFNVNDTGGTIQIGSGLMFSNTGQLNVKNGTLAMDATYTGVPAGAITISSGATLNVGASFAQPAGITNSGALIFTSGSDTAGAITGTGNLTINAATLQLDVGSGASSQTQLTITGGTLDLTNNHFIINYSGSADPAATIRSYLVTGYAGGAWNGLGVDSSSAAANSGYGVGYADGADGVVSGLSSGQIEIKYTLYGDANLDGVVNGTDFGILAANFGKQESAWDRGDFNYDGVVNGSDFGLLAANFGQQASGAAVYLPASDWAALDSFASANGLLADVPEPASMGLVILGSICAIACRRRNKPA